MSVFTRMIHIRSHDLGKDVTLLLTFDKSLPDMYHGVYPIAWRYAYLFVQRCAQMLNSSVFLFQSQRLWCHR